MAKAPGQAPKPKAKPAAAKKPAKAVAAATGSPAKAAKAPAKAAGKRAPTPYDAEYEKPLSELPQLTFPNSADYEFRVAADERRRARIRNETIFGAVVFLGGVAVLVAAHTPAGLALAVIAVGSMAAYELIISGLE